MNPEALVHRTEVVGSYDLPIKPPTSTRANAVSVTTGVPNSNAGNNPSDSPPVVAESVNARKRACEDPDVDAPESKRSKESSPTTTPRDGFSTAAPPSSLPNDPASSLDKNAWQGFCEIESEPAYFSIILREMGVQDCTVREVFTMDPMYLKESLPQPIYGLILVFQYREFGKADQSAECPADVWFANQLPTQNSCATLAMINILMNSAEVNIGEHLDQFKDFTHEFTPFQRGEALASFDFVKTIHNSFAKEMDILVCDKHISHKANRARHLKAQTTEKISKKGKSGTKTRRGSDDSIATDDSAETYTDSAHHFIAFVPVGNEVWKLDGLDAQPTSMSTFHPAKGETWLSAVSDTIAALMAAGDDDYGVVALAQSPLLPLRETACLASNTIAHIESRLTTLNQDWRSFLPSPTGDTPPLPHDLGIESHLAKFPVPAASRTHLDAQQLPALLDHRARLVDELHHLAASILAETQAVAEEEQKAAQRRFDAGPVIKKWLEMLAENGHLERNLDRFMPGKGKKGGTGKGKGKGK